jgi:hypothetical protein
VHWAHEVVEGPPVHDHAGEAAAVAAWLQLKIYPCVQQPTVRYYLVVQQGHPSGPDMACDMAAIGSFEHVWNMLSPTLYYSSPMIAVLSMLSSLSRAPCRSWAPSLAHWCMLA